MVMKFYKLLKFYKKFIIIKKYSIDTTKNYSKKN